LLYKFLSLTLQIYSGKTLTFGAKRQVKEYVGCLAFFFFFFLNKKPNILRTPSPAVENEFLVTGQIKLHKLILFFLVWGSFSCLLNL
jgi:hypothetical protein